MSQFPTGPALIADVDRAPALMPTLWWLGHSGFAIKYHGMVFYADPFLSPHPDRLQPPLLDPAGVSHANMLLSTHAAPAHMDLPALAAMLEASPGSKLVLPRYTAALANANGIPFDRMTTTDNSLRVEYFGMGDYMRVYSVPSMPPHVAASPVDGYPSLGYLIRGGNWTIYHAGECAPYEGLSQRLRPYNVTVALLPVTGPPGNFSPAEAADLANEIAAKWVVPIGYGMFAGRQADPRAFAEQVLSRYPSLRVKLFEPGEAWQIPED